MFLQCRDRLVSSGRKGPYTIYDPCCGSGYLLAAVSFLYSEDVGRLIASDIEEEAVEFAEMNLGLLRKEGLSARIDELREDADRYGRASAGEAIESCRMLESVLIREPRVTAFRADALSDDLSGRLEDRSIDMIITDIPHGMRSEWTGESRAADSASDAVERLLSNLHRALGGASPVVAIASQKHGTLNGMGFSRFRRFTVGKRQVLFFD